MRSLGYGFAVVDPSAMKQLASEAESLRGAREDASPSGTAHVEDVPALARERIDARFAQLSDEGLAAALIAEDPHTRIAAYWRRMVRDQALGNAPPTDGVRLMLLVNLASVQELEVLEVFAELDPCPTVRAAAVTFLWRVARDRDRIVALLLARLAVERAPGPLLALFDLTPALPFARALDSLQSHLVHPVADVRERAIRVWIATEGDGAPLAAAILHEPDRALRLAALDRCARSEHPERMLPWISAPTVTRDALAALAAAQRRFPLAAVAHLIDPRHLEEVLRLVSGPFGPEDRERLLDLTQAFDTEASTHTSPELMRCLTEAHGGGPRTAADHSTIARLRAARDAIAARLESIPEAAAAQQQTTEDWCEAWYDDDEDDGGEAYALASEVLALDAVICALEGRTA
jgi:hypothetical protein